MKINTKEVTNIEFDGVDHSDYPDYSDAYIVSADYKGVPMTDEELIALNENIDFVYESLIEKLN